MHLILLLRMTREALEDGGSACLPYQPEEIRRLWRVGEPRRVRIPPALFGRPSGRPFLWPCATRKGFGKDENP